VRADKYLHINSFCGYMAVVEYLDQLECVRSCQAAVHEKSLRHNNMQINVSVVHNSMPFPFLRSSLARWGHHCTKELRGNPGEFQAESNTVTN
jgi:hypothetical protein